jgi:Aspartyl protease
VKSLVSRLRRREDERVTAARAAHAAGRFAEARRTLAPVVDEGDASLEVVRGMAELEYLLGDYVTAEMLLHQVVARAGKDVEARADAEGALALVYLQTNRYAEAHGLFAGLEDAVTLPIGDLMRSFGDDAPYRVEWAERAMAVAPFLQETGWELPRVAVEVNGVPFEARIDTGGDLFTLGIADADALGIEPAVTFTGTFAGGAPGEMRYGRAAEIAVGGLTVRDVPVSISGLHRPVIGTGFLRQFLPTLDYPGRRLVLRRRDAEPARGIDVPFALALVHLLIVSGRLNDLHATFVVDSGLEDEGGAAFTGSAETLAAAGIPLPETSPRLGESGAGDVTLDLGHHSIGLLALGDVRKENARGLYGAFPAEWNEIAEFRVHGIVSHHFLRDHAWTIDFSRMAMTFGPRAPG